MIMRSGFTFVVLYFIHLLICFIILIEIRKKYKFVLFFLVYFFFLWERSRVLMNRSCVQGCVVAIGGEALIQGCVPFPLCVFGLSPFAPFSSPFYIVLVTHLCMFLLP